MMAVLFPGRLRCAFGALVALALGTASAQTRIVPSLDNFPPAQDVALGREAAAALRKHLAILTDHDLGPYLDRVGRRLADAVTGEVQQSLFAYEFVLVDTTALAALALPGGPMFVSRGLIESAGAEDMLAGVIAHQLSHVALRHPAVQLTGSERYQIGGMTGDAIGAIFDCRRNGIMERAADFAIASYFFVFHPHLERQAVLLTDRILARAGYEAQNLAAMIDWIVGDEETAGGLRGLDALRTFHLQLASIASDTSRHSSCESREFLPGAVGRGVLTPSGTSRSVAAGDLVRLSVPENWARLLAASTVVFAPDGGMQQLPNNRLVVTHGMQVGVAHSLSGELDSDMQALLTTLGHDNGSLQWRPAFQRTTIGGRTAVSTTAANVSPATGAFEHVWVTATHLPDGSFLYLLGVAPQEEAGIYRNAFNRVAESVQILR